LRVQIPPGVRAGQRIRLGGQGGASGAAGSRGDLYLRVELLPHPRFRLVGERLSTHLDVTPWEAALGGEAEVLTLVGPVRVRIPPGSSSGRKIRLRGKGFPAGGGAAGDLIAEIRVVVPRELSDAERELYQQLSSVSSFAPRAEETH
jgi:curved DNA-binding protein